MGLTEEHLCTCDPVIAGVGDSSSGLSSQLWLAVSFHKTSPIPLCFCWIFDVIKDEFYNYDLLSVLLSFVVFFKKSFIMQVMFKKSNCVAELENSFLLYSIWNNYCCLLRVHQIALGHKALTAQCFLRRKKKKAVSSFLQLKIWKNLFKKLLAQEHASFVSIICSSEYNSFYQECSVSYLINVKLSASLTWM